jgi:hypothetical protein
MESTFGVILPASGKVVTVQGPPDDEAATFPLTMTQVVSTQETTGVAR